MLSARDDDDIVTKKIKRDEISPPGDGVKIGLKPEKVKEFNLHESMEMKTDKKDEIDVQPVKTAKMTSPK